MRRTYLNRHKPLATSSKGLRPNPKRRRQRFELNYGSEARVLWFHSLGCACGGEHPACQGLVQASHTISKNHRGDARHIIPQSAGCHGYVGQHGWARWESETSVERHALADHYARLGPDAPGVSS